MSRYGLSSQGAKKMTAFEGNVLHVYTDVAGYETIGKGHLCSSREMATGTFPGGVQAYRDSMGRWAITAEDSAAIFIVDTGRFAKDLSDLYRGPRDLEDHEADALILWDYNTGGLRNSGVLNALNAGRFEDVPTEMLRWNHRRDPKTGKLVVDEGLTLRRQAEVSIWLNGYEHPETDSRLQAAGLAETSGRAFKLNLDLTEGAWDGAHAGDLREDEAEPITRSDLPKMPA